MVPEQTLEQTVWNWNLQLDSYWGNLEFLTFFPLAREKISSVARKEKKPQQQPLQNQQKNAKCTRKGPQRPSEAAKIS